MWFNGDSRIFRSVGQFYETSGNLDVLRNFPNPRIAGLARRLYQSPSGSNALRRSASNLESLPTGQSINYRSGQNDQFIFFFRLQMQNRVFLEF